jgi:hypothetical protein
MRTDDLFDAQLRRKRSRGRCDSLANVVDQPLHECRVIALGHDPDQWLGAGLSDH